MLACLLFWSYDAVWYCNTCTYILSIYVCFPRHLWLVTRHETTSMSRQAARSANVKDVQQLLQMAAEACGWTACGPWFTTSKSNIYCVWTYVQIMYVNILIWRLYYMNSIYIYMLITMFFIVFVWLLKSCLTRLVSFFSLLNCKIATGPTSMMEYS